MPLEPQNASNVAGHLTNKALVVNIFMSSFQDGKHYPEITKKNDKTGLFAYS